MGEGSTDYIATTMAETFNVGSMATSLVNVVVDSLPEAASHRHELFNVFIDLTSTAMRDVTTRFNLYASHCADFLKQGDFKKNAATFKTSVQCVERYVMHNFRQRANSFSIGSGSNDSQDVAEQSQFVPNAHRLAFKECRNEIVNELNIEGTTLMDELVCANLMTDSERQSVIAKHTSKSKSEDFYRLIHGRVTLEQTKNILLPAIRKDHPWLFKHIRKTMKHASDAGTVVTCVCCRMRDQVEVKRIADYLLQYDVISEAQHADLTNPAVPNSVKWKEVLASTKPNIDSAVIASLEGTYPDLFNDFQFYDKTTLDCFCQELLAEVDVSSVDSALDIDIGRMSEVMSISTPSSDRKLKAYKMQPLNQNLCIVLCNNNYNHLDGVARRELTNMHDTDVSNIKQCFGKLNFKTEVYKNKTGSKIVSICQELSSREDLQHINCIAVFILCLTQSDSLIGVDGVFIPLEHALAHFRAKRCPQLAGRPKLFFIQTSRGSDEDKGLVVQHDKNDPNSPWSVLPDDADFFVGFPTASGQKSYGIPGKGSVYINSLVTVLDKYANRLDLLSCMQIVNENMAQMNLEFEGSCTKQISFPMFSLRKQVFFTVDDSHSVGTFQSHIST